MSKEEMLISAIKWEMALVLAHQRDLKLAGRDIWHEEARLKDLRMRLDALTGTTGPLKEEDVDYAIPDKGMEDKGEVAGA